MLSLPFFDHQIGFKIDFPVQDDPDVKQSVLFDLEVRRESMLVPAEKDTGGDGLNIHWRRFEDASVFGGIFDHFFMEHFVLAPAGDGIEFVKMIREGRDVKIAPDEAGGVAILLAGFKILADHELKKPDRVVGHDVNINEFIRAIQAWRLKVL